MRQIDVHQLADDARFNRFHGLVLFWCALIIIFDGYDLAVVGIALPSIMKDLGVERLVLAGGSTHNCVAHTGADAFAHDFRVSYALDAIGSTNDRYAEAGLEILSVEYRQPIIGQAEAEALLG